jgi:hypothetical protein
MPLNSSLIVFSLRCSLSVNLRDTPLVEDGMKPAQRGRAHGLRVTLPPRNSGWSNLGKPAYLRDWEPCLKAADHQLFEFSFFVHDRPLCDLSAKRNGDFFAFHVDSGKARVHMGIETVELIVSFNRRQTETPP